VLTSLLTVSLGDDSTGSRVLGDSAALAAGCSIDDENQGNRSGQVLDEGLELWSDEGALIPATGGELQTSVQMDTGLLQVSGPPESREDHQLHADSNDEALDTLFRGDRVVSPKIPGKKNTKAAIKIATLNMKGFLVNDPLNPGIKINKWNHVNQIMRENNIAILVLQETHLTEERSMNWRGYSPSYVL
jgi:hypothetical protein